MNRPLFLWILFLLMTLLAPGTGITATADKAGPQILTRLPNGLLVYIVQDKRFPLVCTRLYVAAGSATENPKQAGISHVLEHMVFKGTSHRPKGQVAKDIEAKGGYLNAATSFDKTWYITDMPSSDWRLGMDVVKDMAFQASLDPAELEAEKNVVISELERGEDSPMRKLYENLQVAALQNTPYGRPIIGFVDSIKALTVDDLKAYVRHWYQPQNMMLLVAGDIDPDQILDHAQKIFGDLANSSDLPLSQPINLSNAAIGSPQVEVTKGSFQKVYMGIAIPVPGFGDDRSIPLDVLAYLLGGDGTSVLYQKYKYERELVDNISVSNMSMARAGLFTISAMLDADKVQEFWDSLTRDLAALSSYKFSNTALARAKFNLEDSINRAPETLNGLTSWLGVVQFDLGGKQGEENMLFTQRNVDQYQLKQTVENWIRPDRARVRVIAPADASLPDFAGIMTKNWPQPAATDEAAPGPVGNPGQEIIDLDQNCRLILLPDTNAPYVSLELLMPGGNALLNPDQQGLANLTARLLSDGSGEMGKTAIERWLAERAVSLSAHAGVQTFGISMDGPSRFNEDIFNLFHAVLFKPRFDAGEVVKEIRNMKAALKQREDQPMAYMAAKLFPFLFPNGQPYGYDSLGTDTTLDTFNTISVRDFWAKQGGQPWVLAIAGDFNRDAVLQFAKKLAAPHTQKYVAPQPQWDKEKTLNLTLPGKNQAHLMRIFKTVPPDHPDAPGLRLLQAAISGQSGVLFTELRDKQGLGYTVTAFNRFLPLAGFMAFYIGTTPDKIAQASQGFDHIIDNLRKEPLAEETIQAAANRLWGAYIRGRQSLEARAGDAATAAVLNRPLDFEKQQLEAAQKLTAADILRIAERYLVDPYEITLLP